VAAAPPEVAVRSQLMVQIPTLLVKAGILLPLGMKALLQLSPEVHPQTAAGAHLPVKEIRPIPGMKGLLPSFQVRPQTAAGARLKEEAGMEDPLPMAAAPQSEAPIPLQAVPVPGMEAPFLPLLLTMVSHPKNCRFSPFRMRTFLPSLHRSIRDPDTLFRNQGPLFSLAPVWADSSGSGEG